MRWEEAQKLPDKVFRRSTGVKRKTFTCMNDELSKALVEKRKKGGRPNKLSTENMLLMALEYLREYRTYLRVGQSYGMSESNTFKIIRWVENVLIQCGKFNLPGKKAPLKSDMEYEVVVVDVAETPIERPKKNNGFFTLAKRKNIR